MKHVKLFEQFKNSLNESKFKISIPMNSVVDFENAINDEFGKGMLKSANIVGWAGSRHYTFTVLKDDASDILAIKNNILGESVNEDMYDFARDIKSALGPRPSSGEVEQYLGRKLTKYEREAIFGGGSKKSFSSTTKKTVSKTEPWPVGKFKGKMWSELPSWYKKWAESKFNII
tara:strand:- start:88343 stop:88864 length:522 start_codon:yes stop_codon:yes gene_type:complete